MARACGGAAKLNQATIACDEAQVDLPRRQGISNMPLVSRWFSHSDRLQKCLVSDPAHVVTGDSGDHVTLLQDALVVLDGAILAPQAIASSAYGSSTAAAVLNYTKTR